MHRTVRLITLATIALYGLAACGSDETPNTTTTAPTTSVETEEPVAVETEPEAEPTSTDVPDYPEREVKPEVDWMSGYLTANEMGVTGMHMFDPYEFHDVVTWEPSDSDELFTDEITSYCGNDQLYGGIWYLDQPIEEFTNYGSEETKLDDVVVQYNNQQSREGMDVVVNIPITCESWGYIVDTYDISSYIEPNWVLVSEEVAYSIVDIDALAERETRDSHETNPRDIRDTERVHQIYYRFAVLSD